MAETEYTLEEVSKWKRGADYLEDYSCSPSKRAAYVYYLREAEVVVIFIGREERIIDPAARKVTGRKTTQSHSVRIFSFQELSPVTEPCAEDQRQASLLAQIGLGRDIIKRVVGLRFFLRGEIQDTFYYKDDPSTEEGYRCARMPQRVRSSAFVLYAPMSTHYDEDSDYCDFSISLIRAIESAEREESARIQLAHIPGPLKRFEMDRDAGTM